MSASHNGNGQPEIDKEEHRYKNVGGKAVILYGYDATTDNYYPISVSANPDGTYSARGDVTANAIAQAVYDALMVVAPQQLAVPYARDINDQMRVTVTSGSININAFLMWNAGTYAGYYAAGAPASIDPREQLELQSINNLNQQLARWTF